MSDYWHPRIGLLARVFMALEHKPVTQHRFGEIGEIVDAQVDMSPFSWDAVTGERSGGGEIVRVHVRYSDGFIEILDYRCLEPVHPLTALAEEAE